MTDTPSRMFVLMGGLTRQPSIGGVSCQHRRYAPFSSHTHRAADSWTVPVAYCAFPVKFPSAKSVFSIRNLSLQSEERLFKDEYLLDFIHVEEMKVDKPVDVDERVVEQAIIRNVKQFILPFGRVLSAFVPVSPRGPPGRSQKKPAGVSCWGRMCSLPHESRRASSGYKDF